MCRAQLRRLSLVEKSSMDARRKVQIAQLALWHAVEAPVFHANASRIGDLPPALAAKVSGVYADLHELRRLDEFADADEVVVKSLLDELWNAIPIPIARIDDLVPELETVAGTSVPEPPEVGPDHNTPPAEDVV